MLFVKEKIRILCEHLGEQRKLPVGGVGKLEYVFAPEYKKNNIPPQDGWQEMEPGSELGGEDVHYWIRGRFTTPRADENHYLVLEAVTGREDGWDAVNPQGLLYLNGEMAQGYDANHTEAYLEPGTEYEMYNYLYLGYVGSPVRHSMRICSIDRRIERLYYDVLVPYEACLVMDENSDDSITLLSILEQTANLLDMRQLYSEAYYRSVEEATAFIGRELYEKKCSAEGKPIINYIGHTHIDVEWLWARAQTREKIQRSFATASALMKRYPEYQFMLSQPELYRYLKEEAPEKYAELKQYVKEGRWEPEGGMWLEADCNLLSGESLVRQFLYGKAFFREEFGKDSRVLFLPDVFGYSAALPQIMKKCGVDYFVTSKISWNETNQMPVDAFLWQGIDGSEVFTSFITTQEYEGPQPKNGTTYIGIINSSMTKGTWNRFQQKEYSRRVLAPFGFGDGGGGPTKDMLEQYKRLSKGLPGLPAAKIGFVKPHLDEMKKEFDEACRRTGRTPRWVGELYLEFHRGTYTSMARVKRGNRKSEFLLQKTETFSYLDFLQGKPYPKQELDQIWRKVMHDQFHDILPGSSIKQVYEGTDRDYAEVERRCQDILKDRLAHLAEKVTSRGGLLVYNSLGFPRKGMVRMDGELLETAETIPAFGWKVVEKPAAAHSVRVDGRRIQNRYYCLELDECGRIDSLYDRRAGREVFRTGEKGNELQVFEDFPKAFDAWEITDYYKQKMWLLNDAADMETVWDGCRAGIRILRNYLNSRIVQTVWLYDDHPRIDFETEADWHERHQLLKAAFPLDVHAASAAYEIQFGHVVRPTHENTSWNKAMFEVSGHKWVDVAEDGYGVSLLNDCKYGYNVEGSTLKITLIKCGTYPNPDADQGRHVFTYSLLPHQGGFREAGVIREAYCMNQPVDWMEVAGRGDGTLPEEFSLVSCEQENVVLETVKKAEADDGLIVRMYEAFDRRGKAVLKVAEGYHRAYLCDLLENVVSELKLWDNQVEIPISNFEIVTVKLV